MAEQVCIIGGCGHVGLPFGAFLALRGYRVDLVDRDPDKTSFIVLNERAPFVEPGLDAAIDAAMEQDSLGVYAPPNSGDPTAELAEASLRDSDHVVVTVGTPVDEHLNPRLGDVLGVVTSLAPLLKKGAHLMLRSTIFPGTTRAVARTLKDLGRDDVLVSFCPERIQQGHAMRELAELPQIVSGCTEAALGAAIAFFDRAGVEALAVEPEEAELAKLFLNAWRYQQFAAVNQFWGLCQDRGVDFESVYEAMTHNYPRGAGIPRPGMAAGPCLGKDTLQLAASAMNGLPLAHAAWLVNEGFPELLVRKLTRALGGALDQGASVGILGMAFKPDVDDIRESLGFKLKKLLEFAGVKVWISDPHAGYPEVVSHPDGTTLMPGPLPGWSSTEEVLAKANAIVIGTPHKAYRGLLMPQGCLVIDTWDVTQGGVRL